jgi:hypothetical protein
MLSTAARCFTMTFRKDSAFFSYSGKGPPWRMEISAEVRYASPHMIAVTAAAWARPPSESYGSPRAMSNAPRFA